MAGRGPKRPKERVRRFFSVGRIEGDSYLEGPIARCLGRGGKIENRGFFFFCCSFPPYLFPFFKLRKWHQKWVKSAIQ
jgi:hypothetical protein